MIRIKPSPTADSRTCDYTAVTRAQLLESSRQHIADVQNGLQFFAGLLGAALVAHDRDKVTDLDGFLANFRTGFRERDWLDRHYQKNRHHLNEPAGVRDDVNLIDVLDFVADQVMAGMARSGTTRPLELDPEVLMRALRNTAALLERQVVVEREEAAR